MTVLELYHETRERFPDVAEMADQEHLRIWGVIDPDLAYSWFESLAKALNNEMTEAIPPERYSDLFRYLSLGLAQGDPEVRDCIDVSFTENLFWQVGVDKARPYWALLPVNLKEIYIAFHAKTPI